MFCLTELKNFRREFFCAVSQKNSGSEKIHGKGRGVGRVSRHSVECFCLTLPKKHVEESFTVSLTSSTKNCWGQEGKPVSRFFDEIFLPHRTETFRKGTFFCAVSQKSSGGENVSGKMGGRVSRLSVDFFSSNKAY